ncbi:glycosyltransferase [Kaistella sp.]|uniref:glycosyltransferase n=1 Tax=Kaistella sp. TaxID=2782235 RepID=UPI003C4FDAC3
MSGKILFLTTAHHYNDDRIFFHQAKELKAQGYKVKICSLSSDYKGFIDGIEIESYSVLNQTVKQKIEIFRNICNSYEPNIIICSEPLAVIGAKKYRKKKIAIIYDITEWYPSMRMVQNYNSVFKIVHAFKFALINLYAGFLSTQFIFGEHSKKFPLAYLFPFKKKLLLPYFPDDIYISKSIKKLEDNKFTVCYTGQISKEKGIENFFNAVDRLRQKKPQLQISILIVGSTQNKTNELYFSNLLKKFSWEDISIFKPSSFEEFSKSYAKADVCFDLRDSSFENNNCLPIKLFYYIAAGKPVIYTNLKAIREYIDVSKFGYLVDPENSDMISDVLSNYLEHPETYDIHANNARKEFEKKYNWGIIRNSFLNFITQFIYKN